MSQDTRPPRTCNWCDQSTAVEGHRVDPETDEVLACPRLDMVIRGKHIGGPKTS